MAIRLPYFHDLLKLFRCPLSISYFPRNNTFIFILFFLPTSSDLTICPLLHKKHLINLLNIYHIQYINIFTKLKLIRNTRNDCYNHKMVKFPCEICQKAVATKHKVICWDLCNKWIHIGFNNLDKTTFRSNAVI